MSFSETIPELSSLGEVALPASERRTIPFDYAFRYDLKGERDTVHNRTVTVSIEATFTAVSIGYGVVPELPPERSGLLPKSVLDEARKPAPPTGSPPVPVSLVKFLSNPVWNNVAKLQNEKAVFGSIPIAVRTIPAPSLSLTALAAPALAAANVQAPTRTLAEQVQAIAPQLFASGVLAAVAEKLGEGLKPGATTIGPKTAKALKNGIKINPVFLEKILISVESGEPLDPKIIDEAFELVAAPPEQIQFLYSIVDEGTGREFQSEPILNLAGLGTADGMRPFRYFARPIEFDRKSSIRMQIIEKSQFKGELHVSLQGYKTLGAPGTPTGSRQIHRTMRRRR
jgi:hypothetical protein